MGYYSTITGKLGHTWRCPTCNGGTPLVAVSIHIGHPMDDFSAPKNQDVLAAQAKAASEAGGNWLIYPKSYIPSGYLTVRHGKSPFLIRK